MTQTADDRKLKELVLYIANRSEADPTFGALKLNKILFFTDFIMYRRRQRSVTGQEYMRLELGPAPRRLLPIQEELLQGKEAVLKTSQYFGLQQKRLIALRDADLCIFDGEEIAVCDQVIEAMRDMNGMAASDLSHRFLGWKAASFKETIPYETVYLDNRELNEAEIEHGREIARRRAS